MQRSQSYTTSPPPNSIATSASTRPARLHTKSQSYQAAPSDPFELLPATTYSPPSPRGRLLSQTYVRPSLRLDHHMMPSPEEIISATTRGRRSSSTSSTASTDSTASTRSEKRQGRLFNMASNQGLGLLDLLSEMEEMED
jgi:hypothetical protein